MEKDLNPKLREEISARFEILFKKIGNNRQQLANKVIGVRHTIMRELSKEKVDDQRQAELLREVADTERMAAKQLPHLERVGVAPVQVPKPVAESKPALQKPVAPKPVAAKQAKPAPASKPKPSTKTKPTAKKKK